MTAATAVHTSPRTGTCDPATSVTRALLGWGVVAGPLYMTVGLVQALTRDGFDITRHALSLLSNGELGWVQIANFLLTGLMTVAAAVGMRRAGGGTWAPRLVGAFGVGTAAAGVFVADAMDGFPLGTPEGPAAISWHGALHMVSASVGFLCLIAACFVLARHFARAGRRGWAVYSRITGAVFFAGFAAVASGSGSAPTVLAFYLAVTAAWAWLTAVSVHLYRRA